MLPRRSCGGRVSCVLQLVTGVAASVRSKRNRRSQPQRQHCCKGEGEAVVGRMSGSFIPTLRFKSGFCPDLIVNHHFSRQRSRSLRGPCTVGSGIEVWCQDIRAPFVRALYGEINTQPPQNFTKSYKFDEVWCNLYLFRIHTLRAPPTVRASASGP